VYFSSDIGNPDACTKFHTDIQIYANGLGQPAPRQQGFLLVPQSGHLRPGVLLRRHCGCSLSRPRPRPLVLRQRMSWPQTAELPP
jgi:hypothetical protein